MNLSSPKVSICIPTYNGEAFLAEAIESVLAQSYPEFELIIVDDRSTDSTLDIAGRYGDRRIRLIAGGEHLGLTANWNRAIAEARGEYIKILPQDDLLRNDCVDRQVACFLEPDHRSVVLASCARKIVDDRGRTLMTRGFSGKNVRMSGTDAIRKCIRAGTNLIGEPGAVLFKASAVSRAGLFRGGTLYVIDLDYWSRVLLYGDFFFHSEPLSSFRISRTSTSVRIASSQSKDFKRLADRLFHEGRYGISAGDRRIGKLKASINMLGRLVIYSRCSKPHSSPSRSTPHEEP